MLAELGKECQERGYVYVHIRDVGIVSCSKIMLADERCTIR
jgi:hypothetical protein